MPHTMKPYHWQTLDHFLKTEFDCQETGENEMSLEFMVKLQALRYVMDRSMVPTSGYRSPSHSIEARKTVPGYHAAGCAVDIGCHSDFAWEIVRVAMQLGFHGIGVSQKNGLPRFIHLDDRPYEQRALYSY